MVSTLVDKANAMSETKPKHKWKKAEFKPGGEKGKLHRELGMSPDKKIPGDRLRAAARSSNPEIKRDAKRAETMKKWHHGGHKRLKEAMYGKDK